jgi:hypothetical protein
MRPLLLGIFLFVALAVPTQGSAQFVFRESPPLVTAENSAWQINGEPVYFEGAFYYPSGPTVFFSGDVMVRSGIFRGIPLYQDRTIEPYSVVYVPVGHTLMRPYLPLRRDGQIVTTLSELTDPITIPEAELPVGTKGIVPTTIAEPATAAFTAPPVDAAVPTLGGVETIPAPTSRRNGVYLEFAGTRWYLSGTAVHYDPDRFEPVGSYRGFAVYRDRAGADDTIWVTVVRDGPVAPYSNR